MNLWRGLFSAILFILFIIWALRLRRRAFELKQTRFARTRSQSLTHATQQEWDFMDAVYTLAAHVANRMTHMPTHAFLHSASVRMLTPASVTRGPA